MYGSLLLFGANILEQMAMIVLAWFALYFFQTLVEGYLAQDEHEALKAKASKKH